MKNKKIRKSIPELIIPLPNLLTVDSLRSDIRKRIVTLAEKALLIAENNLLIAKKDLLISQQNLEIARQNLTIEKQNLVLVEYTDWDVEVKTLTKALRRYK